MREGADYVHALGRVYALEELHDVDVVKQREQA
jgi:hypothetical protein